MKHSLLIFVVALPLLALNPTVGSEDWILDPAANCTVWNPDGTRYAQIRWIGPCRDGRAQGRGLARWSGPDGVLYAIGDFDQGRLSGLGLTHSSDGDEYHGQWQAGIWHGAGAYRNPTGPSYTGEFVNGQPAGHGVLSSTNGDRYEGAFEKGNFHGAGMYVQRDGSRLEAEWVAGEARGLGVARWANGDRYAGDWLAQARNGLGVQHWASGDRYAGDWLEDLRTGQGVYDWPSGTHYEGTFSQGELTGMIGEPSPLAREVAELAAKKAASAEAAAEKARESAAQARTTAKRAHDRSAALATEMTSIARGLRALGYEVDPAVLVDDSLLQSVDAFLASLEPPPERVSLETISGALTQTLGKRAAQ